MKAAKGASASKSSPDSVYAVVGADDFLRRAALRRLLDELIEPEQRDGAVAEFDGETASLAEVLDELRTMSLLAPRRVVILSEADAFLSRKYLDDRNREESYRDAVDRYLDAPAEANVLILVAAKLAANTRLAKRLAAARRVIQCEPPGNQALPGWAAAHASSAYQCKMDLMAARRLVELAGDSLGRLDGEIGKLAAFVGARGAITVQDVDALVGSSRMEKVFGIKSAIASRDAPKALDQWEQVLATDRNAPYRAVGGLAYEFRKMVQAKQLLSNGADLAEAIRGAGLWGDWAEIKRQLDRFSLRRWQDQLLKLLQIDIGSKSGLGGVPLAVEKLIVELCAAEPG